MKYRRFGRTGLPMPVLSCGGMRYQFKWEDVDPTESPPENQQNLEAAIHRALELGIHHIETARGYGTSEMQLGRLLPTLPRDKIIVQTKVSPKPTADTDAVQRPVLPGASAGAHAQLRRGSARGFRRTCGRARILRPDRRDNSPD